MTGGVGEDEGDDPGDARRGGDTGHHPREGGQGKVLLDGSKKRSLDGDDGGR